MKIAYRGNFRPSFSTESHVSASLEDLGHSVVRSQEDEVSWQEQVQAAVGCDLFMWTRTFGYAQNWTTSDAFRALEVLRSRSPAVGYHLDRWWGLEREWQVHDKDDPFFHGLHCLFTADGDNDNGWQSEGITHNWLPPAVFARECTPGEFQWDLASDIVFVGSWRSYAHEAWWPQRKAMLDYVRNRYGPLVRYWPAGEAIRGQRLNDLFASCKIVLGDSCLADRSYRYFSDRAFETVGRGGFLITPWIGALSTMLIDGDHCRFYTPGQYSELGALIDYYLNNEAERERIRTAGLPHTVAHHTYAHRMRTLLHRVFAGQTETIAEASAGSG